MNAELEAMKLATDLFASWCPTVEVVGASYVGARGGISHIVAVELQFPDGLDSTKHVEVFL